MHTTTIKLILDYNDNGTVTCHLEGESTNNDEEDKLKNTPGYFSTTFISATVLAFVNIIQAQGDRPINVLEVFNAQVKKGLAMIKSGEIVPDKRSNPKRDN